MDKDLDKKMEAMDLTMKLSRMMKRTQLHKGPVHHHKPPMDPHFERMHFDKTPRHLEWERPITGENDPTFPPPPPPRGFHDMYEDGVVPFKGRPTPPNSLIMLLKFIDENEKVTASDVCEHFDIRPSSASESISKAEGKGLIVKTKDEADQRKTILSLSDNGKELISKHAGFKSPELEMFDRLTSDELDTFIKLVNKIFGNE